MIKQHASRFKPFVVVAGILFVPLPTLCAMSLLAVSLGTVQTEVGIVLHSLFVHFIVGVGLRLRLAQQMCVNVLLKPGSAWLSMMLTSTSSSDNSKSSWEFLPRLLLLYC